jgi:hypothetical protein
MWLPRYPDAPLTKIIFMLLTLMDNMSLVYVKGGGL